VPAGDGSTDAALGDRRDEASLRYEHHAMLRLRAKREGLYKSDAKVVEEDEPEKARAQYIAWQDQQIKVSLTETVDAAATDHSTIFTNPMHAEKALAYDVAVGVSNISPDDVRNFLQLADWRYLDKLNFGKSKKFSEYFTGGTMDEKAIKDWIKIPENECGIPSKIKDAR